MRAVWAVLVVQLLAVAHAGPPLMTLLDGQLVLTHVISPQPRASSSQRLPRFVQRDIDEADSVFTRLQPLHKDVQKKKFDPIGSGAYGSVFAARYCPTPTRCRPVAVKLVGKARTPVPVDNPDYRTDNIDHHEEARRNEENGHQRASLLTEISAHRTLQQTHATKYDEHITKILGVLYAEDDVTFNPSQYKFAEMTDAGLVEAGVFPRPRAASPSPSSPTGKGKAVDDGGGGLLQTVYSGFKWGLSYFWSNEDGGKDGGENGARRDSHASSRATIQPKGRRISTFSSSSSSYAGTVPNSLVLRGLMLELCSTDLYHVDGGLTFERRLQVVHAVFDGLAFVHGAGIVHRDIKAENILLCGADHTAKLTDFGLATTDRPQYADYDCTPVGTLAFLPPEIGDVGAQLGGMDVWAAGLVAAEFLLSLRSHLPFTEEMPKAFAQGGRVCHGTIAANQHACEQKLGPGRLLDRLGPFLGVESTPDGGSQSRSGGADANGVGAPGVPLHVHLAGEVGAILRRALVCKVTPPTLPSPRGTAQELADLVAQLLGKLRKPFRAVSFKLELKSSLTSKTHMYTGADCGLQQHSTKAKATLPCIDLTAIPCADLAACIRVRGSYAPFSKQKCYKMEVGWAPPAPPDAAHMVPLRKWEFCMSGKVDFRTAVAGWYAAAADVV